MDVTLASQFLGPVPAGFDASIWAHYSTGKTAAIDGDFNRTGRSGSVAVLLEDELTCNQLSSLRGVPM
jgi:hypothetical protein